MLHWVSMKRKVFIFLFNKGKEKNQANIDVNKPTISVRLQNWYKFLHIKSSILFLLICKHFTTVIFICSNHASSYLYANMYNISRIHPLVPSKCNGAFHIWIQNYYLLHTHRKKLWSFHKKNSSRNWCLKKSGFKREFPLSIGLKSSKA